MKAVLFVSNGHGEIAIAACIAARLQELAAIRCDHLAIVGDARDPEPLHGVGPRKAMPSGGLIAMGNVRNIIRDVTAGLAVLSARQWLFLRSVRAQYCAAIAVGDVFALMMALRAKAKATVFVGTAKSVHVSDYGAFERRIMRGAQAVFVRDDATAKQLRSRALQAEPANVISDLAGTAAKTSSERTDRIEAAIFPGSRASAYEDARFLLAVVRAAARHNDRIFAKLSIAPGLDASRFAKILRADGWRIEDSGSGFTAFDGDRALVSAASGPGETLLAGSSLVLGQAGTANEAAAAAGIPVIAFVSEAERKKWYRKRQAQLLGDALLIAPREVDAGADEVLDLLNDPERRARMSRAGMERMGPPGGAERIARRIAELCA